MIRFSLAALVVALLFFSSAVSAQEYVEGVHFTKAANASPPRRDGKIDVVEVFSYMCPHCASFQPFVKNWHSKMPENVSFSRIPVIFSASWQPYALSYYTAETMGILDQAHVAMFNAIHRERKQFRSMDDLAGFYSQFGVTSDEFLSMSKSFPVDMKLRNGVKWTGGSGWGIQSTPTFVVAGKYRVNTSRAVPQSEMMKVVNFLVAKEAAQQPQASASSESADSE